MEYVSSAVEMKQAVDKQYDTSDVVEMIRSGNNWLTPGTKDDTFTKPLVYAVADGRLSVERLRESASYIARVIGRAE